MLKRIIDYIIKVFFFFLTNMALTLSAISERIICGHLFNYVKIAMLLSFREI